MFEIININVTEKKQLKKIIITKDMNKKYLT